MSKVYHPDSWSKQARELADSFLHWENKEEAIECLKNSYRASIIVHRAIKSFKRRCK